MMKCVKIYWDNDKGNVFALDELKNEVLKQLELITTNSGSGTTLFIEVAEILPKEFDNLRKLREDIKNFA
jgi:hypothetical protein